ncbi:MAG: SRPBCC domain-containing protein [Candidatus Acidiferrales bacterium]
MAGTRNSFIEDSSDREIVVTRVFDAPRELVFKAFTEPKHVAQWWGPIGFTTTINEMDVRPGGVWRLVMHGPDGRDYNNKIVFLEIVKPERIVYKHDPEKGTEPVKCEVTITFAERGEKTEVRMRMVFPTAAEREDNVKKYGAVEGGKQTLGRLAEHLEMMAERSSFVVEGEKPAVIMTRVFDAPRELVFKAWTDAKQVAQWWGPTGFTNPVCELDARPGGAIRIDMRGPDGTVYPMTGAFEEIVEPERLVFTSAAMDKDGKALFVNRNVVTFAEEGGKTRVRLHARVVKTTPAAAPYLGGMEEGWALTLDRLGAYVKKG